jgi:hypothetical protein
VRRLPALCLLCVLVALVAGCGEGGASSGATVSVYAAAPLCRGARLQLRREAATVADLRVRVVCLPAIESSGRLDLAQSGAGARRASEDSTAIAYLEAPGPAAKFSRPIVEAADIAWTEASSGEQGMREVLQVLAAGDEASPRAAVREGLDQIP